MTLVQLRHLIELAKLGSFSQTADKLHLTQPALSRSIKSLEDELGQPLFDRIGRKNELTAFGHTILQHAQSLVEGVQELRQTGQRMLQREIGQVRIGLGSGPGALLMTPLLMHMAQEHPQAKIDIARGSTELLLHALRERCADRAVTLVEVAGGWQFRTAADLAPQLKRVIKIPRRLPRVAMETLAIIAYHQPVTRAEVEEIRGAALSQATLDALLDTDMIIPKGRRETPGRPTLWGTTPDFLTHFGLASLRDLPRREDLLVEPPAAPAGGADEP